MNFDVAWLDLREPADRRARDCRLLTAAATYLAAAERPMVVDLGSGTGSTLRAFSGLAPRETRWQLIDRDAALLAETRARHGGVAEVCEMDIADPDAVPLDGVALVTASALLDLVSAAWVAALVRKIAGQRCGLYAALTYDGGMRWSPALPGDDAIRAGFNRHQLKDKGLGPALGPRAATVLSGTLRAQGHDVRIAASPWILSPADTEVQSHLIDGIAAAAGAAGYGDARAWAQARRAAVGWSSCIIGHLDVLALPPGVSAQSKTTSVSSP